MAQFQGTLLTNDGLLLKAKGETNKLIEFTKIAVGDGVPAEGETVESLTALKSQKLEVAISAFDVVSGGISKATGIISNNGLAVGFYVREIGLFAKDPDSGVEKLYAYTYVSSAPDWLPPEGGATLIESEIGMIAVTGNATNITATIDDTVVTATKRDVSKILGITLDNAASEILQGNTYVFPITNYDGFSTYDVDAWIDSDPIASELNAVYYEDEAYHVNIPTSMTGSNLVLRLKKTTIGLDYFREITIPLFSGGVVTPSITFPSNSSADVSTTPTLQASAFAPVPSGSQTHSQTQWQIATDAAFTNLVVNVTNGTNLTSYPVPVSTLDLNTKYYVRVRYQGSVSGWSSWSGTITFTTMEEMRRFSLLVGDGDQVLYGGCEDNLGNKYCCGTDKNKLFIVKLNSKLEKIAAKNLDYVGGNSNGYQILRKIIYHNGYLYAAGEIRGTTIPAAFFIVKLDTDLNVIAKGSYEKTLSSGTQSRVTFFDIKASGTDIYACGNCYADGGLVYEAVIVRFNESLTLIDKRIYHCYVSADKSIWAGSMLVEASRLVVLIPGEYGSGIRGFMIVTMDRDLASPVTRTILGDGTTYSSYTMGYSASLISDGTNYYVACLPQYATGGSDHNGIHVFKLDANFGLVFGRVLYVVGLPVAAKGTDGNSGFIVNGDDSDIIIGGQIGYNEGTTNASEYPYHYLGFFARIRKLDFAQLTNYIGIKNANDTISQINDVFVDGNNSLIGIGMASTGQGFFDGFATSFPTDLHYSSFGPFAELPEFGLGSELMSTLVTSFAAPGTAPTITTNTTFTLTAQTITLTESAIELTNYTADF